MAVDNFNGGKAMKFIAVLMLAAAPAGAFDLPAMDAAAVKTAPPVAAAPMAAPVKAATQRVWMNVSNDAAGKSAEADDWSSGIQAQVSASGQGQFSVSLRSDQGYAWGSISKDASGYNFYCPGMNLYMSGGNGSYFINGNLSENGKSYFVDVNLSGSDAFDGSAYGSGLSLSYSRGSISGWFDPDTLPKKAVAAITSLLLALQAE